MAGFGSLMVAQHQGIASLGLVMALGTGVCMVASLALVPALWNLLGQTGWRPAVSWPYEAARSGPPGRAFPDAPAGVPQ